MALISGGGHQVVEQGTLACTRVGEPLRVSTSVTQGRTHAAGVWSKHCKVAVRNANGMFARWKLTLTVKNRVFHPGGAVLGFTYFRGQPLKQIFHGKGEIQLFAQSRASVASIASGSLTALVLVALAVFGFGMRRRRPRAT